MTFPQHGFQPITNDLCSDEIYAALPYGIFIFNDEGIILNVNQELCTLLDYEQASIVGQSVQNLLLFKHHVNILQEASKIYGKRNHVHLDQRFVQSNGNELWGHCTIKKLSTDKQTLFLGVIEDVSDHFEVIKELNIHKDLLIQQSKKATLGDQLAMITHQWLQPLSNISILVGSLRLSQPNDEKTITKIENLIIFMNATLQNFKLFHRKTDEKSIFNINTCIIEAKELIHSRLSKNAISFITICDNTLQIKANKNEFTQILLNLFNNSIDAFEENNFINHHNREITLHAFIKQNHIFIDVLDTAGGVSQKILSTIFDINTTTKAHGSGVGLYLTKTIIEEHHNGLITAQNNQQGMHIRMQFPIHYKSNTALNNSLFLKK
jgi:PAS domain S-box-containing protein